MSFIVNSLSKDMPANVKEKNEYFKFFGLLFNKINKMQDQI